MQCCHWKQSKNIFRENDKHITKSNAVEAHEKHIAGNFQGFAVKRRSAKIKPAIQARFYEHIMGRQ